MNNFWVKEKKCNLWPFVYVQWDFKNNFLFKVKMKITNLHVIGCFDFVATCRKLTGVDICRVKSNNLGK